MNGRTKTNSPEKKPLEPHIVWEDANLWVLYKPRGFLSQGEIQGSDHVVRWAQKIAGRPYVGLVHRLDRNTSGLMVVAKRTKAAARLTEALQNSQLERRYLALVEGHPQPLFQEKTWTHYLIKNEKINHTTASTSSKHSDAKKSELLMTPWLHLKNGTLCEFVLKTGRSHQIRAQAQASHCPLVGDHQYGSRSPEKEYFLHSYWLRFPHPISREILEFYSTLAPTDQHPMTAINLADLSRIPSNASHLEKWLQEQK